MNIHEKLESTNLTITAFGTLAAAVFAVSKPLFFKLRKIYFRYRKAVARHDNLLNIGLLQDAQDRLVSAEIDIDLVGRALLFQGHNGGDIPTVDKGYYVTMITKSVSREHLEALGDYEDIRVDPAYIKLLGHIIKHGYYHFIVDKEDDCLLKDYYLAEGVKESIIVYIDTTRSNSIVYASFANFSDKRYTPMTVAQIRTHATGVQSAIRKML